MTKITKDDIVAKTKELAIMIAETEEVDFFKKTEEQINENEKVQRLMNQIKQLQKQAVNNEHYGKTEALQQVEQQINQTQATLDEMPIVQEFKQSQIDVNELLQMVTTVISNTITDEIIRATGGNLLAGETGSKVRNTTCQLGQNK